jgi:hypothetical protein
MRNPSAPASRRRSDSPPQARARTARAPGTIEPSSWIVEQYGPGLTRETYRAAATQLRRTAQAMARDGTRVRYRHSTVVPADEVALSVVEAASLEVVEALYQRAGVRFDRILTAEEV